ncbi:MAG: hypothetical protein J0L53_15840 [Spirochaetes bacterium]|nr:hypothetical protein [Spirochaetota bacterium]
MKISAILAALLYAGAVGAQGSDAMRDAMRTYFEKEKTAALIGMGGAIAAGGTGGYLVTQGDLAKGIGYSLIGIGAIGLVVGGSVYLRTDSQLAKLEKQLETTPREYKTFEGARMERVITQFTILKIAELSIFAGGVATTVVGTTQKAELTTGIGIGLMLDAALLLLFDYFADARAQVYMQQIRDFTLAGRNTEMIQGLSFNQSF